jgi:hypothetical protein
MGSMGEEIEREPELQFVYFTRRLTLQQFHAEFPTLTRTCGPHGSNVGDFAAGDAS